MPLIALGRRFTFKQFIRSSITNFYNWPFETLMVNDGNILENIHTLVWLYHWWYTHFRTYVTSTKAEFSVNGKSQRSWKLHTSFDILIKYRNQSAIFKTRTEVDHWSFLLSCLYFKTNFYEWLVVEGHREPFLISRLTLVQLEKPGKLMCGLTRIFTLKYFWIFLYPFLACT